ncbi:hypothetical protein GCM10027293_22070 [Pontibacter aydingkolensis]
MIRGREIDTTPLAKEFPKHKIPYIKLPVALPDLQGYADTVAVLWYLRNPLRPSSGVINVMLIAQKKNQELVYFIDSNNNNNFLDDGKPFHFKPEEKQKEVEIYDNRIGGSVTLLLHNLMPVNTPLAQKHTPEAEQNKTGLEKKQVYKPRAFGLIFIGGLSSGSGDASMFFRVKNQPDSDERNMSYHYTAKYFASLNTSLGLAFSFRNFYIGGSGSYELSQVGEQNMRVRYEKGSAYVNQFLNNQGSWPYTRFNFTLFTEYDIPLNKKLRLTPMVSYTRYELLTEQPFTFSGAAKLNDYFHDRYAYSYGGKVKYVLTDRSMLFVELYKRENFFDASSYFSDIEEGSFKMSLKQVYGGVGIQVRVTDL